MDFSFLCADSLFPEDHIAGCLGSGRIQTNLDLLISAFLNTTILSISALILAVIFGILIGTMRTLPNSKILPLFAMVWIEALRNIPLLVQLFCWYFVMPKIFPFIRDLLPPYMLAIVGLGFFTSARIAEQVRSGIEAIPTGQRYAGMALGFSTFQTYRYVLLPRALRTIMPPLISESMGIVKNSGAAFAVGITEMLAFAKNSTDITSQPIETYVLVTLLYMFLALIIYLIMASIEYSLRIPGQKLGGDES